MFFLTKLAVARRSVTILIALAVFGGGVASWGNLKQELLTPNEFWISTLDILVHLFLPTIALTLISFAGYIRYSRGTLLEVLNQDYIRTARAKGLKSKLANRWLFTMLYNPTV